METAEVLPERDEAKPDAHPPWQPRDAGGPREREPLRGARTLGRLHFHEFV